MAQNTYLEDEDEVDLEQLNGDLAPLASREGWEGTMDLPVETVGGPPRTSTPPETTSAPPAAPTPIPVAATGGTPMANSPPPPPPPTPTLDLTGYASDWMKNPNRYLSDLVTKTREAGDLRREEQGGNAGRNIDEWSAQRGLTGSSYEGEQRVDLERKLRADLAGEERDILDMVASRESSDRLAAGNFGLDVQKYGSDYGLAREQMQHELRLQGNEIGQRESEFARSQGMDERKFVAEQDQFAKLYSEQIATRMQGDSQFAATLAQQDSHFAIDSGLREKALDLQSKGMAMDEAFRQASLLQEKELTTSAQDLQRLGLQQEDAYRYAALNQDAGFRQRALDLQQQGQTADQAFRTAELEFRQKSTERATLVQLLSVLDSMGGFGDTARKTLEGLLGGGGGAGTGTAGQYVTPAGGSTGRTGRLSFAEMSDDEFKTWGEGVMNGGGSINERVKQVNAAAAERQKALGG